MRKTLLKMLVENSTGGHYPFHMPGHKRNGNYMDHNIPYNIDITEINAFDDLHHPEGILDELNKRAANVFSADETSCLINGSTVGNLAAILSVTKPGDKILVARNCHKSVHNAIIINKLQAVYVYPEVLKEHDISGEINIEDIKKELEKHKCDFKAVVIVSPTYDGVISNIKEIADEVHKYGIPLIVDEAHGAHLGLGEYWICNSNEMGADIVVHSIHKTLPSLTQTALLHMNGSLIDRAKLRKYLSMLQSSSPSYVLLASIDSCITLMEESNFKDKIKEYANRLSTLRNHLGEMKHLELVESQKFDYSKIVISTKNTQLESKVLMQILRTLYKLELEMDGGTYVVAMTTVADTQAGMDMLEKALLEIDSQLNESEFLQKGIIQAHSLKDLDEEQRLFHIEKQEKKQDYVENIADLFRKLSEQVALSADTKISDSSYYMYPPGIPIILPGEGITKAHIDLMNQLKDRGYRVHKK